MENLSDSESDLESRQLNKSVQSITPDESKVSLSALFNLLHTLKKESRRLTHLK